ncbi:VCBS repeat-containing protein [Streptomyces sp. NPDC096934]|uniref:FG-GAP repeat domain-containing protein n=1 Tax=Streptomyces sp. NPDC096934 TaxID=3155551 RepID=UPI00332B4D82
MIRTCVTSSDGLRADLNGDGTADEVSPASAPRAGTDSGLRITFGATHGPDTSVTPEQLVGDRGDHPVTVSAAVADFDRDGWLDLFIAATGKTWGDDPIDPAVSELRLGPFSARGRGQSDHHVDLSEPRAAGVADYNHDRYPDLAAYVYDGDGQYFVRARLGGPKGLEGKPTASDLPYTSGAQQGDVPTPDSIPAPSLQTFYPSCEDKGKG